MNSRPVFRSVVVIAVTAQLLAACANFGKSLSDAPNAAPMDSLVTAQWLSDHLGEPDLVVIDCSVNIEMDGQGGFRPVSGQESHAAGHIPGAGFADFFGDISDPESPYRFAVPSHEQFRAAMGALGVDDGSRVVLYDNSNSAWAARVWWMLRWVGFDNAAILDGGQQAWVDQGNTLSTATVTREPGQLTGPLRPDLIVGKDAVRDAVDSGSARLIDALNNDHYTGRFSMYARPGHISGAINVPVDDLRTGSGRFKPDDELAALFSDDSDTPTITYCGGGIAASATAFAMTRLGYTDVAVYTHSLQEWAAEPDNPMETGTERSRKD